MVKINIYKATPIIILIISIVADLIGIIEKLLQAIHLQLQPDQLIFIRIYYYTLLVCFSIMIWILLYISKKSNKENISIFRSIFESNITKHFTWMQNFLKESIQMGETKISLVSPKVFYFVMKSSFKSAHGEEIYWSNFSPYDLRDKTNAGILHNDVFTLVKETNNIFSYAILLDNNNKDNNSGYIQELIKSCRVGGGYKDNISIIVIPAYRYKSEISVQIFCDRRCIMLYKFEPNSLGRQMEMAIKIDNATDEIISFFKTYWEIAIQEGLKVLHNGKIYEDVMKELVLC